MTTANELFQEWELERKKKTQKYWAMLRRAKDDYLKITEQFDIDYDMDPGAFYYYLQRQYGFKVEIVDGRIGQEYHVIDEGKFMLFIMKYANG